MFLSIIIPIYNDEMYIRECLDSCLNQDIPAGDYEIICVDDGSTDSTPQILKEYSSKYSNVHVMLMPHAGGGRRNDGLAVAKGDYIWFVDHDDVVAQNVMKLIKETADEGKYDRITFPHSIFTSSIPQKTSDLNPSNLRDAVTWTSVIRKDFLSQHNIRPRSHRLDGIKMYYSVDSFFVYECKLNGAKEANIGDRPFYYHRKHSGSETANFHTPEGLLKQAESDALITRFVMDDYKKAINPSYPTADIVMSWARSVATSVATLPKQTYRQGIEIMREEGLLPLSPLPECDFTLLKCIKAKNHKGPIKSILYFYSTTNWGLPLYRMSFVKIHLSRFARKNMLVSNILDYKNKVLRR